MFSKSLFLRSTTAFFAFIFSLTTFSQVSEAGKPFSFSGKIAESNLPARQMPSFDFERLKKEDSLNADSNIPYRFGYTFEVNYTLENSGQWETLTSGDRVWRLEIYSKGALSINLSFNQYILPKGAKVFIFNRENKEYIGAFTAANNQADGKFGTRPVKGERVTVEYYEPKEVSGQGKLTINKVTHAYRNVLFNEAYGFGNSASCHVNVNCSQGSAWQDQKRSVVLILSAGYLCSGAVVNNTSQDGTPYILTADHCFTGSEATAVFVFNYESPDCSNIEGPTNQTVSGSVVKSRASASDFMLLQLNSIPPLSYNVYYSGWSNINTAPASVVGIHHPAGDIRKISTLSSSPFLDDWNGSGINNHWAINGWTSGTTEGGSSGSPLYDHNKRIIGQLHGGTSIYCPSTSKYSSYGAFFYSWNTGATASSRLRDWLDPGNTGATTLNGGYIGQSPCTAPPVAGTTTSSSNPVCNGNSFVLSLSGSSTGTGLSYQWQSSTNGTSWSNISGANSSTYTASQSTATYYRCNVTCSGNTLSSTSLYVTMTTSGCQYQVPVSGTNSITTCSGTVVDNGGASDYVDNSSGILTINPSVAGNKIQLAFTSFSLESGYDYLYIYDGTSTSSTLIGSYTGSTSPGTISALNASGALTLRFTSDGSVTYPGFSATVSCVSSSIITVPVSGTSSVSTCTGTVYDNGGSSNYSDYSNGSLTINPSIAGNKIQLTFTSFAVESCCDYLQIYDGTSTSSPLIGTYYSNPGTVYATNANGALTLRFYSDGSITNSGFAANIACVTSVPQADLYIQNQSASPTSVNSGNSVSVTSYIYNQGTATASSSNIGYYLSTNTSYDASDVYLGNSTGGSLTSGNSSYRSSSVTIPSSTVTGTYYLLFFADYSNAVTESNESNNISYVTLNVSSLTVVPASGSSSVTLCSGTVYDNGGLSNYANYSNGSLTINPSIAGNKVQVTFSSFSVETCCDYLQIFDGSSISAPLIGTYYSNPGTIYATNAGGALTLRFYSDGSITSSGFVATIGCTATVPQPDLVIQTPGASPTTVNAGNSVSVTSNIYNQGNAVAASSNVGYYLSTNATYDVSDVYLGFSSGSSLSPGLSSYRSANLTIPSSTTSGTYYILYYADYSGSVSESNETNNVNYFSISVTSLIVVPFSGSGNVTACSGTVYDNGGLSDYLNGSNGTLTINPSVLGNKVRLSFTSFQLENNFDYLRIYDGTSTAAPLIGVFTSTTSPGTITATGSSGALTLNFSSDGSVIYSGFAATISCISPTPLPDLVVQSPNAPATVSAGNSIIVDCNIYNQGTSSSNSSDVGFYLSTNSVWDAGDTYLGMASGSTLATGSTSSRSATVNIPIGITGGAYYLIFYADHFSSVSESNESNNTNSSLITVSSILVVPQTGSNSITICSGTIYDNGANGNYYSNSNGTLTINPSISGNKVRLIFNSFAVENCCDYLSIYDGSSTAAPLLGTFSLTSPGIVTATNPSGALTVHFYSNGSGTGSGFESVVSCINATGSDLIIQSPESTHSILSPGESFSVNCSVFNQGTSSAANSSVGYYLSSDAVYDAADIYLGYSSGSALTASGTAGKIAGLTIPFGITSGSYYILFFADYNLQVSESDESNNVVNLPITVFAPTSISSGLTHSITIYPNPTEGEFVLDLNNINGENTTISIIDGLGTVIESRNEKIYNGSFSGMFDLNGYKGGIYAVKIEVNGQQSIVKVIVE